MPPARPPMAARSTAVAGWTNSDGPPGRPAPTPHGDLTSPRPAIHHTTPPMALTPLSSRRRGRPHPTPAESSATQPASTNSEHPAVIPARPPTALTVRARQIHPCAHVDKPVGISFTLVAPG